MDGLKTRLFQMVLGCLLLGVMIGCTTNPPSVMPYADVPLEGDIARGEVIFHQESGIMPSCVSCHDGESPASPDLTGYGAVAGERVEGENAHEYTFYSIAEPGRYILEGYGNAMYNQYDENYTPQEMADLIAYLLSL